MKRPSACSGRTPSAPCPAGATFHWRNCPRGHVLQRGPAQIRKRYRMPIHMPLTRKACRVHKTEKAGTAAWPCPNFCGNPHVSDSVFHIFHRCYVEKSVSHEETSFTQIGLIPCVRCGKASFRRISPLPPPAPGNLLIPVQSSHLCSYPYAPDVRWCRSRPWKSRTAWDRRKLLRITYSRQTLNG